MTTVDNGQTVTDAADLRAVAVGDVVKVYGGGRGSHDGKIVKIGRTLVHVEMWGHITTYRRDTQQRRDGYPGHFRTLAQEADDERRSAALKALREYGLELSHYRGPRWTGAQLTALVEAVARIMPEGMVR